MDNDLATIQSLSPSSEGWTRKIQRLLSEIEKQKVAGVTYARMAAALRIDPTMFRVYLHRARKRASAAAAKNNRFSTKPFAIGPIDDQPDLTTQDGRKAAQAARFNINILKED